VNLLRRPLIRQLLHFGLIGVASTIVFSLLYTLFREFTSAPAANTAALLLATVGNTAANRYFTFGVRGNIDRMRHYASGLLALGVALAITNLSIIALGALLPDAGRLIELAVLVVANGLATIARFLILRWQIGASARLALSESLSEPAVL